MELVLLVGHTFFAILAATKSCWASVAYRSWRGMEQ